MVRYLPALFLVGFVLEIASIIWVGGEIGLIPTLLLLVAGGMVGASLVRSAGLNVATVLRTPLVDRSLVRGLASATFLRMTVGVLFIIPGFFSDFVGVALLLPPLQKWLASKVKVTGSHGEGAGAWRDRRFGTVIEAEAIELEGEIESAPPKVDGA